MYKKLLNISHIFIGGFLSLLIFTILLFTYINFTKIPEASRTPASISDADQFSRIYLSRNWKYFTTEDQSLSLSEISKTSSATTTESFLQ